jgi:hypothetical protein
MLLTCGCCCGLRQIFGVVVKLATLVLPPQPVAPIVSRPSNQLDYWIDQAITAPIQQRCKKIVQAIVKESNYFRNQMGISSTAASSMAIPREAADAVLLAQDATVREAIARIMSS